MRIALRLIILTMVASSPLTSLAQYEAMDDASDESSDWEFSSATGFGPWMFMEGSGSTAETPVASATAYSGSSLMDTAGKAFVLQATTTELSGMVDASRSITATVADGAHFQLNMQAPSGFSGTLLLGRDSGRFGRIRANSTWELVDLDSFIDTGIPSTTPVRFLMRLYGSTGAWEARVTNLQNGTAADYTGLAAEFGSGQLKDLFFSMSPMQDAPQTLIFNEMFLDNEATLPVALTAFELE